jgi:hypothetical protein
MTGRAALPSTGTVISVPSIILLGSLTDNGQKSAGHNSDLPGSRIIKASREEPPLRGFRT